MGYLAMSGMLLLVIPSGMGVGVGVVMLQGFSGMLLDTLQCTGQAPKQRVTQPNMSVVPRLKNPALTNSIMTPR